MCRTRPRPAREAILTPGGPPGAVPHQSPWGGPNNQSPWGGPNNQSAWGGPNNQSPWGGPNNQSAWGGTLNLPTRPEGGWRKEGYRWYVTRYEPTRPRKVVLRFLRFPPALAYNLSLGTPPNRERGKSGGGNILRTTNPPTSTPGHPPKFTGGMCARTRRMPGRARKADHTPTCPPRYGRPRSTQGRRAATRQAGRAPRAREQLTEHTGMRRAEARPATQGA